MLFFTLIGWALWAGLGVAVGYHRVFSHNTHPNLSRWKENMLLICGILSGQGSSIVWTAIHRGYHHRWSDTDRDLHSPLNGYFHSVFGWTLTITDNNPTISLRYAGQLLKKSNHLFFYNHALKIQWAIPLIASIISWKFALMFFILPGAIAVLQDNLVNVFGHIKGITGYRNFNTKDNSHNNILFGYLAWGQGWHNNHHYDPGSFDFGKEISGKWWEWDPAKIFLPLLK